MYKQSLRLHLKHNLRLRLKFWGKVRSHNKRGKRLGFPTANVNLNQSIPEGIYISLTKIKGGLYPSLTFIGQAKTFVEAAFLSETFILDFDQNLYNEWISVKLIKKIRANKKFKSEKELIEQMKRDKEEAINYFKSIKI